MHSGLLGAKSKDWKRHARWPWELWRSASVPRQLPLYGIASAAEHGNTSTPLQSREREDLYEISETRQKLLFLVSPPLHTINLYVFGTNEIMYVPSYHFDRLTNNNPLFLTHFLHLTKNSLPYFKKKKNYVNKCYMQTAKGKKEAYEVHSSTQDSSGQIQTKSPFRT